VNTFEMQSALELVRLVAEDTRWQARCIDLKKGYCLEVTDSNHARITFGLDKVDQQLERLIRYLDLIEPTKKEIQTVNLMVERNTPITFSVPESEQPPAPLPTTIPKPSATPAPSKSTPPVRPAIPVTKSAEPARSLSTNPTPIPAAGRKSTSPVTKRFRP